MIFGQYKKLISEGKRLTSSKKLSLLISQGIFLVSLPWLYQLVSYLHPIAIGVVWICLTAFVFFVVFGWRGEKINISYTIFLIVFILYNISLIILLFFRPQDQSYDSWNLIPFATIGSFLFESNHLLVASYNLLANIGLFVPWGWFFMYHGQQWTFIRKLYIPFLCICVIEITQLLSHRGSLDIDDLILNLLGVFIGYFTYPWLMKVVQISKS